MDQLKEILRQAIKYRFWIAVGLSALLPMIAYFIGSDPIKKKAATEETAIKGADTGVKKYASGAVPNKQYTPLVKAKTEELTKDVNASWKKLYERQAPLLTWPEPVKDRFPVWGRVWPANEDPSRVTTALYDYVQAYPAYVDHVYKSFHPFNPEDGTGVVSAPPEEVLLSPAKFEQDQAPKLGEVWAAQERLWIQRTLLDVIATVNKDAKDWNTAIIRQINVLAVGSRTAMDQRSIAKGDMPEAAPAIDDPNAPAEPAADTAASTGPPGLTGPMGAGSSGSGDAGSPQEVYYIKNDANKAQFTILPVQMTVLIDQDHIQDLFVALENSPMTIQVKDFEMSRPTVRVTKPEKGSAMNYGGYGAMGGMAGGYGGQMSMMMQVSAAGGGSMSNMNMQSYMTGPMGAGGGGMGGMGGPPVEQRKSVDARSKDRRKEYEERVAAQKKKVATSLQDPYYNIVEVTVTGQARFFNAPTETPAEPSQSENAAPVAAAGDDEKKDEAKPSGDETKKADTEKADETKKADTEKADETKKADEAKTTDPDTKKADPDTKKADEAKTPEGQAEPKGETQPEAEPKKAEAESPAPK